MNRRLIVLLSFVSALLLAYIETMIFRLFPEGWFFMHNLIAVVIGILFIVFSLRLVKDSKPNAFLLANIIIGIAIFSIHAMLLFLVYMS